MLLLTGAALQVPCTNVAPTADSFLKSKDCKHMNQNAKTMLSGSTTVLHDPA